MRQLRAGLLRLAGLFNTQKHDREMAAEIESHLQMHIEDNLRAGMAADEARRQAIMKLGGIEATQEKCRDRRGVPMIENLLKDLRFGVRMLKKSPGFTSVAVLTLGLGIGANTAVFSIVNAVLLRPLPLPHGERVASIQVTPTVAGETTGPVSPNQFRAWMVDKTKFERLAAARGLRGQISGTEAPEEIRVLQVSPEFQELAGLRPYLGRTFLEDDFRRGATRTCLISYRLWQRSFSEDRSIVGRTCYLDSEATVIIGVLPHDLGFPDAENDIWTVLLLAPEHATQRFLDVYGRLASGVSVGDAQAWLTEVTAREESELPDWRRTRRVSVTPIREQMISDQRTLLLVLGGIAICVLLICCANMSNLLLARHLNREREMALRASLGATKGRLMRQLLTEALVLCLAGTLAGFVASRGLLSISHDLLSASRFKGLITLGDGAMDMRIAAFTILLSLLTTVMFGMIPTLHITRMDLNEALKSAPRGHTRGRSAFAISQCLIAVELAVAFVLLTGAGLLVQSFVRLVSADRGYTVDHLLTARLPIPRGIPMTPTKRKQFFRELMEKLEALPNVAMVGIVTGLPLGGPNASMTLQMPGQPLDPENLPWASISCVNSDYFRAMGIPLVRGRAFDSRDKETAMRVAVINQTLQHQFWPDRDAIGQEIMPGIRVVGIVKDIQQEALETRQGPAFYLPFEQRDGLAAGPNVLLVRTKGDPQAFTPTLKAVVKSVDYLQPLVDIRTMEEVLGRSVTQRRLLTSLIACFAALAVFLSIVGIYGVLSYLVSNRTQEIGIRMCLGAQRSEILILLARQLSSSLAMGLVGGLAFSLVAAQVLSRWLFAVRPNDSLTLMSAVVATSVAAVLGGIVPAMKALHVDPLAAVRSE